MLPIPPFMGTRNNHWLNVWQNDFIEQNEVPTDPRPQTPIENASPVHDIKTQAADVVNA